MWTTREIVQKHNFIHYPLTLAPTSRSGLCARRMRFIGEMLGGMAVHATVNPSRSSSMVRMMSDASGAPSERRSAYKMVKRGDIGGCGGG